MKSPDRRLLLEKQIHDLGFPPETGIARHWREEEEKSFTARLTVPDCEFLREMGIDPESGAWS